MFCRTLPLNDLITAVIAYEEFVSKYTALYVVTFSLA
jgi:hypothetical protein